VGKHLVFCNTLWDSQATRCLSLTERCSHKPCQDMGPKFFDDLVHPTYLKICNQTKHALGKVFKVVSCDSLILLITTCCKFFSLKFRNQWTSGSGAGSQPPSLFFRLRRMVPVLKIFKELAVFMNHITCNLHWIEFKYIESLLLCRCVFMLTKLKLSPNQNIPPIRISTSDI
jgi:hypothetical protein